MKLEQIQDVKLNRAKRRYQYLADERLDTFAGNSIEIDSKFFETPGEGAILTLYFFHVPWRTKETESRSDRVKQETVDRFAEKFAEEHGIPYTEIECSYMLLSIRYYYK